MSTKSTNIVILGYSNAGKDTTAQAIAKRLPNVVNRKFSQPMKDALEMLYELPKGFLEDRHNRGRFIAHLGITYHELMIRCWKYWNLCDPMMGKHKVINEAIAHDGVNIFTDIRSIPEARIVKEQLKPTTVIYVLRPGVEPLESDSKLSAITEILQPTHVLVNTTLEAVEQQVNTYVF